MQVYVPRFFVASQQRFGATDIKALGASQLSGLGQTVLQLLVKSVLQLHFIYKIAGESKTRREGSGGVRGEGERERERESARACMRERESEWKPFGSSFYMFFPPLGPALCKLGLARSAVCSVCSAWSLHSGPQTFLWPSLSFNHRHFGLLFPILPT